MIEDLLTGKTAYRSAWPGWSASFAASSEVVDFRIHFLAPDHRFIGDDELGQDCATGTDGDVGGCGIPYDWITVTNHAGRQNDVLVAHGCNDGPGCVVGDAAHDLGSYDEDRNGAPKTGCGFGTNVPTSADRIRM